MNKKELDKDAYGWQIWDFYNGKDSYEIIERDDGWFGLSQGAKSYFSEYKDWNNREKRAMKHVKGKVLDIGCGAGRHSLWLQKKGFNVIGIDNSPLAIKVCKLRGLKDARVMPIDDIGKFKPKAFDTIIMFGNNFGLFGSFKKAKILLKKMHRITSDNAMIITESRDPYSTENKDHLSYHKFNRKRGRMSGQTRIRIIYGKHKGNWFDYLIASKKEIEKILKGTGWRIKKVIREKEVSIYLIVKMKK